MRKKDVVRNWIYIAIDNFDIRKNTSDVYVLGKVIAIPGFIKVIYKKGDDLLIKDVKELILVEKVGKNHYIYALDYSRLEPRAYIPYYLKKEINRLWGDIKEYLQEIKSQEDIKHGYERN
jgi:hypothetical protein